MTVESRMTERHESIIFTSRSFCALRACSNVARRAGCSRVGADPATGMGPSAVSSRRPFQKFRRRHTDSPASSYELASSAQSSFRFFRMEWPAFDPRTAKGCLICWTGRRRHSVLLSSLLLWKLGSGGGNSRKRYLVRGKKNRSSLNRSIYYYSFIPLHGKEKKKKDLFEICIIPEERENIDEYSLSIILQENIISSLVFAHGLLCYAWKNARKRNGGCVVRNGRNALWEEHRDGGPLVLQGGNDARQRSSMSSEAGQLRSYEERSGPSRRVERIILANLNLNLTTDFSQSRLDETRGVYVRLFPLLFNRCCFLSRPAKDTRGEIRPEVSWKFFLLILVVLSWDRVVNNLTADQASDRNFEGREKYQRILIQDISWEILITIF